MKDTIKHMNVRQLMERQHRLKKAVLEKIEMQKRISSHVSFLGNDSPSVPIKNSEKEIRKEKEEGQMTK